MRRSPVRSARLCMISLGSIPVGASVGLFLLTNSVSHIAVNKCIFCVVNVNLYGS